MKKTSIDNIICVSVAAVFLVCVPVFAFIFWPVALLMLVLSAALLWLGKPLAADIAGTVIGKLRSLSGGRPTASPEEDAHETAAEAVAEPVDVPKQDAHAVEDEIKAQLDEMDMITASAIAIMLSDAKAKANSPYIKSLEKVNLEYLLFTFLRDSYHINDIRQLGKLFSSAYYKKKIRRYMKKVVVFVRRGISYSLPRKSTLLLSRSRTSSKQLKIYLGRICGTLSSFESVKFIPALSGNEEISSSRRNYKLDHLSDYYKDALIYLVDVLLTCTCISKMLFAERMIRNLPRDSEFARIIENLANTIDDHNLIISKSRPIYQQYYQAELGYIRGDDLLYGMAVTIMVNRIKRTGIENAAPPADVIPKNARVLDENMRQWLDGMAERDSAEDVGALILQRVMSLIKGNYGLLLSALSELLNWEAYYEQRVTYYIRQRDKERYLKGDLDKEILELSKYREKEFLPVEVVDELDAD